MVKYRDNQWVEAKLGETRDLWPPVEKKYLRQFQNRSRNGSEITKLVLKIISVGITRAVADVS